MGHALVALNLDFKIFNISVYNPHIAFHRQRWGPYIGGGEIAQGPIQILPIGDITWTLTEGYNIWGHLNFPMLNPHWPFCKCVPHLCFN